MLGPAIPPGFGLVMGWLMDNGHMMHPADAIAALEEVKNGNGPRPTRSRSKMRNLPRLTRRPKRKRKVSAYQKEFGRQLKRLKKKHPRTPVQRLMKRAHAATRKARRGK
tara:strand:+ start:33 stop:359 length:327 start_codon:yes stop_codon:yes gene_type:complete